MQLWRLSFYSLISKRFRREEEKKLLFWVFFYVARHRSSGWGGGPSLARVSLIGY